MLEVDLMKLIDINPMNILLEDKPPIKAIRYAIKKDERLIKFFPTLGNVKMFLHEDNFDMVQYMHKLPMPAIIQMVEQSPDLIMYVSNPPIELQKHVVTIMPCIAASIDNVDDSVLIYALQKDPSICASIKTNSISVQRAMIKIRPESILQFRNPSEELILLALDSKPSLIEELDSEVITPTAISKVIKQEPRYAKLFDLTEDLQLFLVMRNPFDIKYIKDPTERVMETAVAANPESVYYIKKVTPKVMKLLCKYIQMKI